MSLLPMIHRVAATTVPPDNSVDGVAGTAVFVGVIVVIGAGVGFLAWSKRRNAR